MREQAGGERKQSGVQVGNRTEQKQRESSPRSEREEVREPGGIRVWPRTRKTEEPHRSKAKVASRVLNNDLNFED